MKGVNYLRSGEVSCSYSGGKSRRRERFVERQGGGRLTSNDGIQREGGRRGESRVQGSWRESRISLEMAPPALGEK